MSKIFLKIILSALILLPTILRSVEADEDNPGTPKSNVIITGSGATFPFPIYAKWAEAYKKETGIELNYQSIGSGGGIKQIQGGTIDFGASDKPLTKAELEKSNLIQFPAIMGGIVIIVNLEGIDKPINLTGEILSKIYQAKITKWNDDAIKAINPDIKFPDSAITVVHRSEASGTTFLFTNYLSQVDTEWKSVNPSISWPTGLGGKGNEGVASIVKENKNSIGYVEFSYATENQLKITTLKNKDGIIIEPSTKSFSAAAENAKWDADNGYNINLKNQPGKDSWPITTASFILLKKDKNGNNKRVADFYNWSFKNGKEMSEKLNYIHLPESLITMINDTIFSKFEVKK